MIRAKAARKAYAAIARARRRRRHDDMVDAASSLGRSIDRLLVASRPFRASLKELARQMRAFPVQSPVPPRGHVVVTGPALVFKRNADGSKTEIGRAPLVALTVLEKGYSLAEDADLSSENASQVHERLVEKYRMQREELAGKPAPDGMQWAPGHFSFNCAGEARQGPPMLVHADPRQTRMDPRPCTCRHQVRTLRSVTGESWNVVGPIDQCDACRDLADLFGERR